MKASVAAVGVFAAVASAHSPRHFHWNRRALNETETTLTVSVTQVQTVISCAPTVTNCPAKQTDIANLPESQKTTAVVTQTVPLTTTVCPIADASSIASSLVNEHISSNAPVFPTASSTFSWGNGSSPITSGSPNQPSLTTSVIPIVTDVPTTIVESGLTRTTLVQSTIYSTVTVPCSSASGITSAPGAGNGSGNGNGDDVTSTSTSTTTGTTTVTVSAPGATQSNNSPTNGNGNGNGNNGGGNNSGNGNNSDSGDCVASTVTVTAPASTVYVTIGGGSQQTSTGAGAGVTSTGAGSSPTGTKVSSAPGSSPTGGNGNNGGNNGGNGGNNGSDDDECDDDDTTGDDDECDDDEDDDDECPPESTTTLSATVTVPFPTGNGTQPTPTSIFPTGGFVKLRR